MVAYAPGTQEQRMQSLRPSRRRRLPHPPNLIVDQGPGPSSSSAAAPAPAPASPASSQPSPSSGSAVSQSDGLGNIPTSSSIGNTVNPGSVSFVIPTGSGSVSPLYRIDQRENVTFSWEYESVLIKPINLTLAAVGPNSVTYTITTLAGGAVSATWNIANVPQNSPLMHGYYAIQLYDQRGLSASESPGWLSPQTSLTIAFYSGETYANATSTKASTLKAYSTVFIIAVVTSCFFIYGILY
ncbi:hypothetical protein BX666DRAFT_1881693 [Dichotomocladium elegans]|nr:hypothetical protein BX666DRAFT_1881693 [Dichotomocladium elegans]